MKTFLLDNSRSNLITKNSILRRSCGIEQMLSEYVTVYLSEL